MSVSRLVIRGGNHREREREIEIEGKRDRGRERERERQRGRERTKMLCGITVFWQGSGHYTSSVS